MAAHHKYMKVLDWIICIVAIVAMVNWGLVGLFHFNLISAIFVTPIVQDIIYTIVGILGIIKLIRIFMKK